MNAIPTRQQLLRESLFQAILLKKVEKMRTLILLISLAVSFLSIPDGGRADIPIISDFKDMVDREAAKTVSAMSGAAIDEAEQFVATLRHELISPTLREIDRLVSSNLAEADRIAKDRISQLAKIVRGALIELRHGLSTVDELRDRIKKDILEVQQTIVDNTFCATDALRAQAKSDVDDILSIFEIGLVQRLTRNGRIIHTCRQRLGLVSNPSSWQGANLFEMKRCTTLESIHSDTPAKTIANHYADLQKLAATTRCVFRNAPNVANGALTDAYLKAGRSHDVWYWASQL